MSTENCYFFGVHEIAPADITVGPPSAEAQVYDVGDAPFDAGDLVWDGGRAYRSLVDANSDALTVAASWADLGEIDQGADLWTAGNYAEGVYKVLNGRVWRSAQASNSDEPGDPANPSSWTDTGPTNRLKAFDLRSSAAAVLKGGLNWTFVSQKSMNAMLLILPRGGFANVKVFDAVDGSEIFNEEYRLTRDSGGGPYNHDFSPIEPTSRVIVHGLPPGTGNTISVEITGSENQDVRIAQIATGFAIPFGATTTGSEASVVGLVDVVEDQFGNVTFPNRPVQRVARFSVATRIQRNDAVLSKAAQHINKPAGMYMIDGVSRGLAVFGRIREVNLPMPNTVLTKATIEIKGFAE